MARWRPPATMMIKFRPSTVVMALPPDELLAYYNQLIAWRMQLVQSMAGGVVEIETPGVGRVEYHSVADLMQLLRLLDHELELIAGLLGLPTQRRRPIHPVAIE